MSIDPALLQRWMAACLGFGIPLAAIGIPLGGFALQPADVAAFAYLGVTFATADLKVPRSSLKAIGLTVVPLLASWTFVLAARFSGDSLQFYAYYVLFIAPLLWACALVFCNSDQLRSFLRGFVASAVVTASLSLLAFAAGVNGSFQAIRNNHNFSLPTQPERLSGIMPEASSFAHILTLAILVLFLSRRGSELRWPQLNLSPFVSNLCLLILVAALLMTKSTSIFAVLPALALIALYCEKKFGIKQMVMIAGAGTLVAGLLAGFYHLAYAERGDTAEASASNRLSTVAAVMRWAEEDGPVVGVGLGHNAEIVPYVVAVQAEWGSNATISGGINSLLFSRFFEEGALAAISFFGCALALIMVLRWAGRLQGADAAQLRILALIATWSLLCSFGAGYRGLYHLWLFFPAAASAYVVLKRIRRLRRGSAPAAITTLIYR